MKENSLMDSINKKKKAEEISFDPINIEGADMTPDDRPMFEYPEGKEKGFEFNLDKQDVNTLVAGATPMLVGLLTGNTGDALDVASAGIMKQEDIRRENDKSLISYLQKRTLANQKASATGGKKRYQGFNYEDDKGVTRQGTLDTFTGERKFGDTKAGYSQKTYTDKRSGDVRGISGSTGKTRDLDGRKLDTVTPVFKKERDARYKAVTTRIKPDLESLRSAESALSLLELKGTMPTQVALNMAVKITEGRATDEDRVFVQGAVGQIARIEEAIKETKDSKVVARKKEEATELFKEINRIARQSIKDDIENSAKSISKTDEQYQEAMTNFADLLPERVNAIDSKEANDIDAEMRALEKKWGFK